jgi:metal-responsive CopG/Arc/MetJ family transcriptional regulator
MAKVMLSLPDDLLKRIDMQARARHESRSGFLRKLAERELAVKASRSDLDCKACSAIRCALAEMQRS